jgi:SAM-dependent methyltransferase
MRCSVRRQETAPDRDAEPLLSAQERMRVMRDLFDSLGWFDVASRRLLHVGCGAGDDLLEFLRMGFSPRALAGIEPSSDRFAVAMQRLPAGVTLMQGDPALVTLPEASEDIVFQREVFSTQLDAPFQWRLAQAMWRWVRPGGGVLWYDLAVNSGAGDRGCVSVARVRELFPEGRFTLRRVALRPELAQRLSPAHPVLYACLGALPLLCTHALIWIEKPSA